jgi:hypothetical protein
LDFFFVKKLGILFESSIYYFWCYLLVNALIIFYSLCPAIQGNYIVLGLNKEYGKRLIYPHKLVSLVVTLLHFLVRKFIKAGMCVIDLGHQLHDIFGQDGV